MVPISAATFQPGFVLPVLFAGAPQRPMAFPAGRGLLVNVAGAMMVALNATGGAASEPERRPAGRQLVSQASWGLESGISAGVPGLWEAARGGRDAQRHL